MPRLFVEGELSEHEAGEIYGGVEGVALGGVDGEAGRFLDKGVGILEVVTGVVAVVFDEDAEVLEEGAVVVVGEFFSVGDGAFGEGFLDDSFGEVSEGLAHGLEGLDAGKAGFWEVVDEARAMFLDVGEEGVEEGEELLFGGVGGVIFVTVQGSDGFGDLIFPMGGFKGFEAGMVVVEVSFGDVKGIAEGEDGGGASSVGEEVAPVLILKGGCFF